MISQGSIDQGSNTSLVDVTTTLMYDEGDDDGDIRVVHANKKKNKK
jgi:hypothetical protein